MKRLLLIIITVIFSLNIIAQNKETKEDYLKRISSQGFDDVTKEKINGVKGGVIISNIIGEDLYSNTTNKIGFYLGLYKRTQLSSKSYFGADLLFSQKGFNVNYNNINEQLTTNLYYFDFPFYYSYMIDEKISLSAGAALSVFVLGNSKFDGESEKIDRDDINPIDYGIDLGLTYYFNELFSCEIKYARTLSTFIADSELDVFHSNLKIGLAFNY
tara:strand:+ start:368 stop:1012 length:645 start_codon:yes stop_codon:yes gene_type:complete